VTICDGGLSQLKKMTMLKPIYIPASEFNYKLFTQFDKPYWTPLRRVPLKQIKIDKSLMSYPNPVYEDVVQTILEHFDVWQWIPVTLNENHFLLDGQHRLEAARRMGLNFIDAVIQDTVLLDAPTEKKPKRRRSIFDIPPPSPLAHGRKVVL
jgi:hypothetical protein